MALSFLGELGVIQNHEPFSGEPVARAFLEGKAIPVELCVEELKAAFLVMKNHEINST